MAKVVPMLRVPDVEVAMTWYQALGFTVTSTDAEAQQGGALGWCELCLDGAPLMLRSGPDGERAGHGDVTLSFDVADPEALFELASQHAEVVYAPRRQPYGRVDFEVRDPQGYRLLFGADS